MTIRAMNWAWEVDLPPALKLVLLKLADRANDDGECWPGQASVAKACGIGQRTLVRHLSTLEEMGLIKSERRYGEDGKRSTNMYVLALSANLAHGLSAKSCTNHVPTVALTYKEEPTVLTHSTHAQACARDPDPIIAEPVQLVDGRWIVDDAVVDRWVVAYQAGRTNLDTEDWIEAELAKAALWLEANPRKRKKNLLRFLTGWLTRASQPPQRRVVSPASRGARSMRAA